MGFKFKTLYLGETEHYVWQRDIGNLVIVVIDDQCGIALADPDKVLILDQAVLPLLRKHVCSWEDTRAIGFFRLMGSKTGADKVLEFIHQKWLDEISDSDTRVYFLVDVLYGDGVGVAIPHIIEKLAKSYLYPQANIAYLTRGGTPVLVSLPSGYTIFQKGDEAGWAQTHKNLSPELMSFFGKGMHADGVIDAAIRFYATPWKAGWNGEGWDHDYLEDKKKNSDQLRALVEWLGESVLIDDLVPQSSDKTESAKSLMIWHGEDLWEKENPPWKARDRRRIKGKVLNAVLKKLDIPFDPIPDDKSVTMPCVPCFPFLVSLRSFLQRCKKEEIEVSKMYFFQLGENPQVNIFRLVLPLKDPSMLAKKLLGLERTGAFTSSLRDVPHCRTSELTSTEGKDYMRLFTEGTELPVVAVEIGPGQINLIWSVR